MDKIRVHTEKVIQSSPYGAIHFAPPNYPHKNTFFKFSIFYDGITNMEFYSRNGGVSKKVTMKRGDGFLVAPDDIQNFVVKDWKNYCFKDVYILKEEMEGMCNMISPDLYSNIMNAEYAPIIKLSTSSLFAFSELHSNISIVSRSKEREAIYRVVVFYLLGQLLETQNEKKDYPKWLKKLIENMEKEEFITLSTEEMVKSTNYSHGYVCRQFKKYLKMPLKQYIIKQKLAYSCNMLTTTDHSLDEIAYRLEFSTLSNYIYSFKKEYDITPGKYRKEHTM